MNSNTRIFLTGIGTDVGKTVASAIVAKALDADYWKPIQAGDLNHTDSMKVAEWIGQKKVYPEAYRLHTPASPHYAAEIDHVHIALNETHLPDTSNTLVIEGAGGILVPVNNEQLLVDALSIYTKQCIVVSRHYLGSINHTLLTTEVLTNKGFNIRGVLFVGEKNHTTEQIIIKLTGLKNLGTIPWTKNLTPDFIEQQARALKPALETCLK